MSNNYGNLKMNVEVFNADKVKKRIKMKILENRKKMRAIVKYYGNMMLRLSQKRCPVDTGKLRKSLNIEIENGGMTAFLNSDVFYAADQEFTTWYHHSVGTWGYMRKSLRDIKKPFTAAVMGAIKD